MKQFVDIQTVFVFRFFVLPFECVYCAWVCLPSPILQEPSLFRAFFSWIVRNQPNLFGLIDLPSSRYAQLTTQRFRNARSSSKHRTRITLAGGRHWELRNIGSVIDFHCPNWIVGMLFHYLLEKNVNSDWFDRYVGISRRKSLFLVCEEILIKCDNMQFLFSRLKNIEFFQAVIVFNHKVTKDFIPFTEKPHHYMNSNLFRDWLPKDQLNSMLETYPFRMCAWVGKFIINRSSLREIFSVSHGTTMYILFNEL